MARRVPSGTGACLLACALSMLATPPGHAGQSNAGDALTAGDRIEIQQLVARYAHALDRVADDGAAFAELFTADGMLVHDAGAAAGRAALAQFAVRRRAAGAGATSLATNVVLSAAADGASGQVYVVVITAARQAPGAIVAGGRFADRYVRTPRGWRFARREFIASRLP